MITKYVQRHSYMKAFCNRNKYVTLNYALKLYIKGNKLKHEKIRTFACNTIKSDSKINSLGIINKISLGPKILDSDFNLRINSK